MKNTSLLLACALVCAVGACSGDALAPEHGTPSDLIGMWTEDFGSNFVPGISFIVGLSESANVVTGQGSYAGEAAPYGMLDVTGSARADSVHLRIVYTPNATVFPQLTPDTAQFDGVLTTHDHIDGKLTRAGGTGAFALKRFQQDPP